MGCHEKYGHVFVNQRYRAVLHLRCRVTFGVYVADFLQLQCPFKSHGIVEAAPHVKGVLGVSQCTGNLFYLVVLCQYGLDFVRNVGEFGYRILVFLLGYGAFLVGEGKGEESQNGYLSCESLGRCHADFRAYVDVYAGVRCARNARTDNVHYAEAQRIVLFCQLECRQRVGGFAAL